MTANYCFNLECYIFLILTFAFQLATKSRADSTKPVATLRLTMHYYENLEGTIIEGIKCSSLAEANHCSLKFQLAAKSGSSQNVLLRYNQNKNSEPYSTDAILFHGKLGLDREALKFPFEINLTRDIMGEKKLNIEINVDNLDTNGFRYITDYYKFQITFDPPQYVIHTLLRTKERIGIDYPTLAISYSLLCNDANVYGKECETVCEPQDSPTGGHYVCDIEGNKLCLPGWIQPATDCRTPSVCSSATCLNDGVCHDLPEDNAYWCECPPLFGGAQCQIELACKNGGQSKIGPDKGRYCECPPAFSGALCESPSNVCSSSNPCRSGATCINSLNGYTCSCPPGKRGINCSEDVDECAESVGISKCENGGTCVNLADGFRCICPAGWTGPTCETDIDECRQASACQRHHRCVNTLGSFVCVINDGNDCEGVVCANNATCIDLSFRYFCRCQLGFVGEHCDQLVSNELDNKFQALGNTDAGAVAMGYNRWPLDQLVAMVTILRILDDLL